MTQNIKTIKVGTFNLMNLMLPNRSVYGGSLSYTQDEYRKKSNWVKYMLGEMDADIIGFQELFHQNALVNILKDSPKYKNAKVYMAEDTEDQPSVALLSKFPVENLQVYTHFPEEAIIDFNPKGKERVVLPFETFTRPVLKADVYIPQYGLITVFVVHLKSKREIYYAGEHSENPVDMSRAQSRSLMLRAAESVALRALVANALEIPDRPVILCGDVNDTGNAVTSRMISGDVPHHKLSESVKRRMWDLFLYHVKDIQARRSYQDFYYTHIHNGVYESLDHIMVSQELVTEYPRNTGRVGLVSVFNDHLIDQTFTNQGQDKCKSDHGVVVCSIELNLERAAKYSKEHTDSIEILKYNEPENHAFDNIINNNNEIKPNPSESNLKDENEPQPFNLQKSLKRWKENHSQQPSRRTTTNHERNTQRPRIRPETTTKKREIFDESTKNRNIQSNDDTLTNNVHSIFTPSLDPDPSIHSVLTESILANIAEKTDKTSNIEEDWGVKPIFFKYQPTKTEDSAMNPNTTQENPPSKRIRHPRGKVREDTNS